MVTNYEAPNFPLLKQLALSSKLTTIEDFRHYEVDIDKDYKKLDEEGFISTLDPH